MKAWFKRWLKQLACLHTWAPGWGGDFRYCIYCHKTRVR